MCRVNIFSKHFLKIPFINTLNLFRSSSAFQAAISQRSGPHVNFVMTSSSKTIWPNQDCRSSAICLLPEKICSQGTEEACNGSTFSAIQARVGYNCALFYEELFRRELEEINKWLTCHHLTRSASFFTVHYTTPIYWQSSDAQPSSKKKHLTLLVIFRYILCSCQCGCLSWIIDNGWRSCNRWPIFVVVGHLHTWYELKLYIKLWE